MDTAVLTKEDSAMCYCSDKMTWQTPGECEARCYQLSGIIHSVFKEQESLQLRLSG